MTALKNIPSLVGATVVAAAAVGLTAGLAPASAAPAQSGANLYIYPDPANSANYRVTIKGMYPMSEYDAHGYIININNGQTEGHMVYDIYGDDGRPDYITPARKYPGAGADTEGYLRAESDGIHFLREISLPKGELNEDTDGVDEIYTRALFVDSDWGTRSAYTNVVTGTF
jgi:hypothetical protein